MKGLLVAAFALLLALDPLARFDRPPPLPLVDASVHKIKSAWEGSPGASVADFPLCVTVKPRPLLRSPQGRVDYRPGEPFNDKGIS